MLRKSKDHIIWGANYFCRDMQPGSGWLLWDKGQRIDQADGELAASSRRGPLRIYTLNRVAIAQDGAVHPTQKPLSLFKWCLGFFPEARTVIDPYLGSGTTLLACKEMGKSAVGIDACEEYCEMAANRLRQEVFQFGGDL